MSATDETIKDAERYRLLKEYVLRNGFLIHQRIPDHQEPFVLDEAFHGYTFEEAEDTLKDLEGKKN